MWGWGGGILKSNGFKSLRSMMFGFGVKSFFYSVTNSEGNIDFSLIEISVGSFLQSTYTII